MTNNKENSRVHDGSKESPNPRQGAANAQVGKDNTLRGTNRSKSDDLKDKENADLEQQYKETLTERD